VAKKTRTPLLESDSKSARTRERLLDAAAKILARKGFAETRLFEIAEEAQMQPPAVYYYFPSREDLIEEVMYSGAASMRQHLETALAELPPSTPPAKRIAAAVEAHLRHELAVSDYARAITRNSNQLPEPISRRALAEIAQYYDVWRGLVSDLADAGQLRDDVEAGTGRMFVLGALNSAAEWWDPERGSLDDFIKSAQSMVLHALRP
jgi:TetR/AcrR family transcriptional regulator, cholesterol catabolism regulator